MADLIDEIHKASDEDVQYFSDIIGNVGKEFSFNEKYRLNRTAKFKEEKQKLIKIVHGTHESHYVWHISPLHPKRPWAVSMDRIRYAIGKILNDRVPHELVIDIFLPDASHDIDEITIKANDAANHWSMSDREFQRITGQFFDVLNTLV